MRRALRAGALALAGFCAGCANVSDPVGYALLTQDKYDFDDCKEINSIRLRRPYRIKELAGLVEKAEASPGGFIVSGMAYKSELTQERATLRAAERAAKLKGCEPVKP